MFHCYHAFITCALSCELAYLVWPLHFSHLLLHSSPVTYQVSTFCMSPQLSDHTILPLLTLFYWNAFHLGFLYSLLWLGKKKLFPLKIARISQVCIPRSLTCQFCGSLLSCILLLLFSNSLFLLLKNDRLTPSWLLPLKLHFTIIGSSIPFLIKPRSTSLPLLFLHSIILNLLYSHDLLNLVFSL